MSYIRNPRDPNHWESDGNYDGKFKAADGTTHTTAEEAIEHDKPPAAPPVLQAEPQEIKERNKALTCLYLAVEPAIADDVIKAVRAADAAIRREAERAAFEKAAQVAESHISFYYSAANEIAGKLRALADSPVSGRQKD